MISSALFARYARALADITLESGEERQVAEELATYDEIFRTVPEFLTSLDSPAIPRDVKQKLLSELIAQYPLSRTTDNFIRVLLEHNRIRYFPEILSSYIRTTNERKGIITAQVTAAVTLGDQQLSTIRESLSKATGKSVNLDVRTDADLLGGLVLQVGSTVYDGSIRKQLDAMRRHLQEQ